ncbi:MAG: DUF1788 domain-containing protein [Megasphaera sp.]|jgi:hypothetical protein|nr:DUF1788 domain-containing protein [Megasphaera sp.]
MATISERLDQLEREIKKPRFRQNRGKANEVNYWVFDYDPKKELEVREWINYMEHKNAKGTSEYTLAVFDMYDLMIDHLEKKHFIDKTAKLEQNRGLSRIMESVRRTLRITDADNVIVSYIAEYIPENAVVFLIGIGKCYPLLEAEEVFNKVLYNMPSRFADVPMILFYPGTYTEQELIVFNEAKEHNYYRAFRIVR